ncbi:MAG: PTS sugar transporter subunit IIA [Thermoanaerobaculia bacterium]|nr:PTS sugar transporter subunit IIA [Thermoanaerobaculia bacterium]
MELAALTGPDLIFPDLPNSDSATVLLAIAQRMAEAGVVSDAAALYQGLREREELGSTGLGGGVAIPHCKAKGTDQVRVSVGICRKGVDFGASDGKPVRLFFTVVSPHDSPAAHLQSLAAISRWVKEGRRVSRIVRRKDPERIFELLREETG